MSQVLAEQYNTNNDVVNNNRSEWHKNFTSNGLIEDQVYDEGTSVYSASDVNEKHFTGKYNLKQSSKQGDSRFSNIQDGLESSISAEGKDRVRRILNDVNRLSDVEKLLLYLKLPTGITPDEGLRETPTSFLHSSNRIEQAQAFTWIRSHLEEDIEICVPKHEVYDDYRLYCESHNLKPLCPADFGKVMKCVFPGVKPRRLGQRGQSKYCYSGLRKKLEVQPPSLPELELTPKKEKEEKTEEDEVYTASRQLVCEWAHKLLGGNFSNLRELAEFLVGNLYVNSKSTAAFTILAAMQDAGLHNSKVPVSSLFTCSSGGNKHKETQLQLQRKLQERELIKEQKRKLQQQRSENERENEHLRAQTASVSPSPFQPPVKSAARNITKLLQSPGAGDIATKASPVAVLQHMVSRGRDGKTSVELSLESLCNGHSQMEVQMEADSPSSRSGRDSETGQYHVVKKPSVRTAASSSGESTEMTGGQMDAEEPVSSSVGRKTPEKNAENGHFALPTTPNRSAFVPVSNQWKDSDSPSIQLSQNHNHIPSVKSESQSQESDSAFMDASGSDSNDGLKFFITDFEQGEHISGGKDICSPITVGSDGIAVSVPSSPLTVGSDGIAVSVPSSPLTPKKSKSRFTPIRPKVTPTKTVSSILKDQKAVNGEGPAYDSRPVSAILKERRAREAQEILAQFASNVQLQGGQLTPVTAVSSDMLKLPLQTVACSKSNEVFIIVGGSPKPGSGGGQSAPVSSCGFDLVSSSQFPPNVTAPMQRSPVSLPLLLAKHNEAKLLQANKRAEANSLDNSDQSDNEVPIKLEESLEKLLSRDSDIPLGRKRKSSEKEVESRTKRMNSTDMRKEDIPSVNLVLDSQPPRTASHCSLPETVLKPVKPINHVSHEAVLKLVSSMSQCSQGQSIVKPVMSLSRCSLGEPVLKPVTSMSRVSQGESVLKPVTSMSRVSQGESVLKLVSSMSRSHGQAIVKPITSMSRCSQGESVVRSATSTSHKLVLRVPGSKLSVESLESDALLDSTPMAVDQDLVSSLAKPSPPSTQTASVGVSAKSMRTAQKQLLQEKLQLDQRLSNFFSKGQKGQKEGETASQQLTVADKKRVEQILQQYVQQHRKNEAKIKASVPTVKPTPVPNNQPVNLLSLLQRPVFDSKVVLSSINKSKESEIGLRLSTETSVPMMSPRMTSESSMPMSSPKLLPETTMSMMSPKVHTESKISLMIPKTESHISTVSRKMPSENNISMLSPKFPPDNKITLAIPKVPPEKNISIASTTVVSDSSIMVSSRTTLPENHMAMLCSKMLPNSFLGFPNDDLFGSDLPSDVADFITENMAARENLVINPQQSLDISKRLRDIIQMPSPEEVHYDSISDNATHLVNHPPEHFTVPPTPPPRQKSDAAGGKVRYLPVQRSISLPVFVPTSQVATSHCPNLMDFGKGLDMPAPPNRVIESSSPQPLHQKSSTPVHFPSPGRQAAVRSRQTSSDRLANHTPMSDAGYHSFAASPVMNSAPLLIMGTGDSLIHNTSNVGALSARSDSAQSFANEHLPIQSPVPLASPQGPSARSTPNSVASPHMPSHSSINPSPSESITSPNSFMPIQGGMSPNCPSLGSPQLVTPIKPLVTVAASPSYTMTSATFTSALLMQLTSSESLTSKSSIAHYATSEFNDAKQRTKHAGKATDHKEPGTKTGVLEKLLNSKSLPSYEEALNHLCKNKVEEKGAESGDRVCSVSQTSEGDALQGSITAASGKPQSRSKSSSDPEHKAKHGKNPVLLEALERGASASDSMQLKTSDYPFSYQLALLKEKCLNPNPSGKENKSKTVNKHVGQSVQRKSASSKPSETKSISNESSVDMSESSEKFSQSHPSLLQVDSPTQVNTSIIVTQANATHHHYGTASQKASATSVSQSSASSGSQRSKSTSATAARPHTSTAQLHSSFSASAVPSASSASSTSSSTKPRQSASTYQTFDLPNVNYMGNAPNIDLGSLLQVKQGGGAGGDGVGGDRLTLIQGLPPPNTINEEELQSTLEILRSLDSQYFSSAELDVDSMQPSPQSQHSPAVAAEPPGPGGPPANSPAGPEHRTSKRSWSYPNNVSSR